MNIFLIILGVTVAIFLLTVLFGAPYVPSKRRDVIKAFDEIYDIGSGDTLIDIGSGDGVICRIAADRGARAIGYEINPTLVAIACWLSRNQNRVSFRLTNFWTTKLPDETTIVYTFGDSRDIDRMARYVQKQATRLDKTIYFMSYSFALSDRKPLRQNATHNLYEMVPLQPPQA